MPFDPIGYVAPKTKPDLSEPSLEGLAWLLRHPRQWHPNFEWNYHTTGNDALSTAYINKTEPECGSAGCAIGLARIVWGWGECDNHGLHFPMKDEEPTRAIFNNARYGGEITAEVVAQRIDDFLAGRPIATVPA